MQVSILIGLVGTASSSVKTCTARAGCSGSLQRDEARAVCGTNARLAVLDGLVANGELSKVVADHVRLDLNLHCMGGAVVKIGWWVVLQHDLSCHQQAKRAG